MLHDIKSRVREPGDLHVTSLSTFRRVTLGTFLNFLCLCLLVCN